MKKAAVKNESHAIDFQQILDAMRPFARFQEAGWAGTLWEDQPNAAVMVRWKDNKQTDTVLRVEDFARLLDAYRMAGGK